MAKDDDLRTVLAPFLKDPSRSFRRDDLRPILKNMSADPIQKALQEFENDNILDVEFSRGRPKGGKRIKNYHLSCEMSTFEKVFQLYSEVNIEELMVSNYTNSLIKEHQLDSIYNIIRNKLEITNFRKIASKTILRLPSTIREYSDKSRFIKDYVSIYNRMEKSKLERDHAGSIEKKELLNLVIDRPEFYVGDSNESTIKRTIRCAIRPVRSRRFTILEDFDRMEAILLYRSTMHNVIKNLFSELHERSFITRGLSLFMRLDNYLSPFTSFPAQNPDMLLFHRPFQRIYDDFYLFNENDLKKIEVRATILYNNFADILFEYFRNNLKMNPNKLEQWIKQFIFYWNVTKTSFDLVWEYLDGLYQDKEGSGKFHVYLRGAVLKVMDLETNEFLPEIYDRKGMIDNQECVIDTVIVPVINELSVGGMEIDSHDPYTYLESCSSFWNIDCPGSVQYEQILSDIKSKFAEYGWGYDD